MSSVTIALGVIGWLLGFTLLDRCHASSSVSVGTAHYHLIPRGEDAPRKMQSESPGLISFDGDLEAIKQQALAKANRSPTSFSCDDEIASHLEIIQWVYSIETVPQASVVTVFGEVQEITLESVAPETLSCYNNESSFANIVAMDNSDPGHEISNTGTISSCLQWLILCFV
jgi:hypothetical protein